MTGEDETMMPDRVELNILPDGGTILRAYHKSREVYSRVFTNQDIGRDFACSMFRRSFRKSEITDYTYCDDDPF